MASTNSTVSSKESKNPIHVLIIGAGITGLLIAQGLKQASIPFTIFESEIAPHSRRREWTLGIHWSVPFLRKLLPATILSKLRAAYADPFYPYDNPVETVPIYNSSTGDVLKRIEAPGMIRVSRGRMRELCTEGLDLKYGKKLVDIVMKDDSNGVTARFEDGSEVEGDIIIGSDGPWSTVRKYLVGEEKARPIALGLTQHNIMVSYKDAKKARHVRTADPVTAMAYDPAGIFSFISIQNVLDSEDPTTWTFQLAMSWKGEPDENLDNMGRIATLKQKSNHMAEPWRSAFHWIPDDTPMPWGKNYYWVPVPWDNLNGRVTLAGDAAHPMLPYRGQGLNHCICDASRFVDTIAGIQDKNQLAEAVTAYDSEMFARGKAEVESSIDNAEMILDWTRMMESPMMKHGSAKTS